MTVTSEPGSLPAYGVPMAVDHTGAPSLTVLARGQWRRDAACGREDDSWWFTRPSTRAHQVAVAICASCPVRRQCLAASLVYAEEFGIWGGTSAHHRPELVARLRDGTPLIEVLDHVLRANKRLASRRSSRSSRSSRSNRARGSAA